MKLLTLVVSMVIGCGAAAHDLRGAAEAKLYNRLADSAVVIESAEGLESGTVISNRGGVALVLTCAHGIPEGEAEIAVIRNAEDATHYYPASVEKIDRAADLALLRVTGGIHAVPAPLSRFAPSLYERVYSVAAPLGIRGAAASHTITALVGEFYHLVGFVIFGSSGSGIMNAKGELVCVAARVAAMRSGPVPHLGFCIPLAAITSFVRGYRL